MMVMEQVAESTDPVGGSLHHEPEEGGGCLTARCSAECIPNWIRQVAMLHIHKDRSIARSIK